MSRPQFLLFCVLLVTVTAEHLRKPAQSALQMRFTNGKGPLWLASLGCQKDKFPKTEWTNDFMLNNGIFASIKYDGSKLSFRELKSDGSCGPEVETIGTETWMSKWNGVVYFYGHSIAGAEIGAKLSTRGKAVKGSEFTTAFRAALKGKSTKWKAFAVMSCYSGFDDDAFANQVCAQAKPTATGTVTLNVAAPKKFVRFHKGEKGVSFRQVEGEDVKAEAFVNLLGLPKGIASDDHWMVCQQGATTKPKLPTDEEKAEAKDKQEADDKLCDESKDPKKKQ